MIVPLLATHGHLILIRILAWLVTACGSSVVAGVVAELRERPELDPFRTCGECYHTVSGDQVYPRCPECGAPLDLRRVA